MIDTDKYEGHLIDKAVGDNSQVWCWSKWMLKTATTIEQHKATAALLEDAPLILEEVKRLREQGRKLIEAAERVRSDISDQDTGWYYQLGNHIEKMNRLVIE